MESLFKVFRGQPRKPTLQILSAVLAHPIRALKDDPRVTLGDRLREVAEIERTILTILRKKGGM